MDALASRRWPPWSIRFVRISGQQLPHQGGWSELRGRRADCRGAPRMPSISSPLFDRFRCPSPSPPARGPRCCFPCVRRRPRRRSRPGRSRRRHPGATLSRVRSNLRPPSTSRQSSAGSVMFVATASSARQSPRSSPHLGGFRHPEVRHLPGLRGRPKARRPDLEQGSGQGHSAGSALEGRGGRPSPHHHGVPLLHLSFGLFLCPTGQGAFVLGGSGDPTLFAFNSRPPRLGPAGYATEPAGPGRPRRVSQSPLARDGRQVPRPQVGE